MPAALTHRELQLLTRLVLRETFVQQEQACGPFDHERAQAAFALEELGALRPKLERALEEFEADEILLVDE